LLPITAIAGDTGYKVIYDGGSLPEMKTGANVKLYIEGDHIRFTCRTGRSDG